MQRNEGDLIKNMTISWDEIAYIQIGDNPNRKEPTTGEINFTNVFKFVYDQGYKGIMGMEHGNAAPGKEGEAALTVSLPAEVKADLREASIDAMTPISRFAGELIERGLMQVKSFEEWWEAEGSGIAPADGDDMESHAYRVARAAWMSYPVSEIDDDAIQQIVEFAAKLKQEER